MEITEVRIKLMPDSPERLLAFCSLTIEGCFVIRDLKIIRGVRGSFVAMPSRKLTARCPKCSGKNTLRSHYCNHCGRRLHEERSPRAVEGRPKLYADIAHPINSECRDAIQQRVMEAYEHETVLAQQPGYVCRYDDYGDDYDLGDAHFYDEPGEPVRTSHDSSRSRTIHAAHGANGPHAARALHAGEEATAPQSARSPEDPPLEAAEAGPPSLKTPRAGGVMRRVDSTTGAATNGPSQGPPDRRRDVAAHTAAEEFGDGVL